MNDGRGKRAWKQSSEMLTSRRRTLIAVFPILLLPYVAGGRIGSVEVLIWFALGMIWLNLFIFWGRRR